MPLSTLRPSLQCDYICTYCTSVRCTVNSPSTVCTEYIELRSVHTFIYIYYIVLFGQYVRLCTVVHIGHNTFQVLGLLLSVRRNAIGY